jgi:alcohol dehydrogenase class IV
LAVSLLLPDFLTFNYDVTEKDAKDIRGVDYIKQTMEEIFDFLGGKNSMDSKLIMEKFILKLGLSANLSGYGIKYNDVDMIVKNLNNERIKNNPRKVEASKLREMIKLKVSDR